MAIAPVAAGAYSLFSDSEALYVPRANGSADIVRSRLAEHLAETTAIQRAQITAIAWQVSGDSVALEAQMLKKMSALRSRIAALRQRARE